MFVKRQEGLSYIKYPKSGLGAFLDISGFGMKQGSENGYGFYRNEKGF